MKTCRHCEQAIEHCPHVPARFCRGWRHAGFAAAESVIAHFCGGQSNGALAEPGEPAMTEAAGKVAGSG